MSDQGTDLSWTTSELKTQPNSPTNGDQDGVEVNPHRALLEFTLFELNQAVTHASASSYWADAAVLSPSEYILIDDQQNLQLETQDRLALIAVMAKVAAAAAKLAASAALQAKLFAEDAIPKSDDIFKSAKLATEAISLAGIFVSTCCVNKLEEAEESLKRLTVEAGKKQVFGKPVEDALVPDAKLKDMGDTSLAEGPVVPATILSEVKKEMKPSDVNACDRAEDCKSSKIQLENMSKSQPGSKTEKADQIVADTKFKAVGDTNLPDGGPVEPATPLSEVKQETRTQETLNGRLEMEPSDVNAYDRAADANSSQIQSENMSKSQPGSKEEKSKQTVEANPLAKDDTSVGRLQCYSKTHKFWETQPVVQYKDIGDMSLPEGPIDPATLVSEVKQEPYNLPGQFEWTTCDMKSDDTCAEVYKFFKENYPDDGYQFMVEYSREFLRWALCPPGYDQSWHIGVRVKTSKKLVAFISGVPSRIRVRAEVLKMPKINFLCVHKKNLRSKRLAPVLIKELTRRVHLQNIWQAVYTSLDVLPTPVTTCQYWGRMLNPKKLIDVGFSCLRDRMTMNRTVKLYKLPDAPITPGFREMEPRDVPAVTDLLRNYLCQFGVANDFDGNDVEHWLLPRKDVVHSYLVVSPETHDVTDFCSFYSIPFTILGTPNTTVECAYSYYNVVTKTSLPQLMKDALIVSKQKGFDIFYALDVMHNESFLKELIFDPGDDAHLYYYLYNYRLRCAMKPSELGLVLW